LSNVCKRTVTIVLGDRFTLLYQYNQTVSRESVWNHVA